MRLEIDNVCYHSERSQLEGVEGVGVILNHWDIPQIAAWDTMVVVVVVGGGGVATFPILCCVPDVGQLGNVRYMAWPTELITGHVVEYPGGHPTPFWPEKRWWGEGVAPPFPTLTQVLHCWVILLNTVSLISPWVHVPSRQTIWYVRRGSDHCIRRGSHCGSTRNPPEAIHHSHILLPLKWTTNPFPDTTFA